MAGYDWRVDLLNQINAPVTQTNLAALSAWAPSEGTPASWNNPLATTLKYNGSVDKNNNNPPVQGYQSIQDGVTALAKTLKETNNGTAYSNVIAAFQQGNDIGAIWAAINNSPWCSGCQNGTYPTQLYSLVGKGPAATAKAAQSFKAQTVSDTTKDTKSCYWDLKIPIPMAPDLHICMDNFLWSGMILAGAAIGVVGFTVIAVGAGSESKTMRQVASAATKLIPA